MTRLRYNGLSTTLGALLTSSATAVTFAAALTHSGGTAVPTIAAGDSIPLSILDSTGKLSEVVYLTAYTAGATTGTITRGREGTTGVSHASGDMVVHGPLVTDFGGFLAAPVAYVAATDTGFPTQSTTHVDVDATNLAITFTTPASGKVLVHLGALGSNSTDTKATFWSLREGTTTIASRWVCADARATFSTADFVITGLTPGSVHTYKWGHATASSGTAQMFCGPLYGQAIMTVQDAGNS